MYNVTGKLPSDGRTVQHHIWQRGARPSVQHRLAYIQFKLLLPPLLPVAALPPPPLLLLLLLL
jgi:hypothetical protein